MGFYSIYFGNYFNLKTIVKRQTPGLSETNKDSSSIILFLEQ